MELRVENLCKACGGVPVLRNLTFTAGAGVTAVMAPSGAGKTTLLRLLLGLEQPNSGRILRPRGWRLSAVFQEDRLLEQLDAEGNLRFVLGRDYDETKARRLLGQLGLEADSKPVHAYSGGMKRRLALARALLAPFDLLVLDEPFTGLDGENRSRAIDCIRRETTGKCVLLVTHDAQDAAALAAAIVNI